MAKSSTSGGIGIGTLIFWVVMWNIFFGDDDEDKKPVDTTAKVSIGDKIDKEVDRISISFDSIVKKIEEKLDNKEKVVAKNPKNEKKVEETEKAKNDTTEKAKNDDPYEEDDLYGSTDDKW